MLTFNVKKRWYEKIASGEKRIEYRIVKPYWTKRIAKEVQLYNQTLIWGEDDIEKILPTQTESLGIECIVRLGYTKKYMKKKITKIKVINGKNTDLCVDEQVYAIFLSDEE